MTIAPGRKEGYGWITGATSGFGYEFAKLFDREGYNLVLVARSDEALRSIVDLTRAFPADVLPIAEDPFRSTAAEEIYTKLHAEQIVVDVLVNDAVRADLGPLRL